MKPERLNAFTDGVIAIIITIMVLELKLPHEPTFHGFLGMAPFLGVYALAFANVGIYWANHHHLMQGAKVVDGRVLWANLFLLFWLSLVPFEIRWIGEAGFVALPVAAYGGVMVMAAFAYLTLERALIAAEGDGSKVGAATGSKKKELISLTAYVLGFISAFWAPLVAVAFYVAVSLYWIIPDRRFERSLQE